jgi:phosphoglycerate dehydrogenase-like enzyme
MYLTPPTPLARDLLTRFLPPGCELLLMEREDQEERLRLLDQAEVLVFGGRTIHAEEVARAPKLRLVHHQGVGWHDRVPGPVLKAQGIRLAICPAGTAESVAEHALMLMIATMRHVTFADAAIRRGEFPNQILRPRMRLLHGKTVGLIGMGRIARHLASLLKPFGVRGLYSSPNTRLDAAQEQALGFRHADLDTLLAESDVVSLHMPITPASRHMIGRSAIARMKPGAFLVNTARGPVVDEAALVDALRAGHLGGAGLDVYDPEPPLPDNPLFGLDNVVLTPHLAAGPADTLAIKLAFVMANVARFFADGSLEDEVIL